MRVALVRRSECVPKKLGSSPMPAIHWETSRAYCRVVIGRSRPRRPPKRNSPGFLWAAAMADASRTAIDQSLILQRDAIDQARAALDSAEAERVRASLDHTRYAALARDSWATRQRFETASADAQKADAGVVAAKSALASAQQRIEVLSAQRKEAEAKFGRAKAVLDQAKVDLDKTVVKAPIDGAILKVNVRLGEYAQ